MVGRGRRALWISVAFRRNGPRLQQGASTIGYMAELPTTWVKRAAGNSARRKSSVLTHARAQARAVA